MAQKPGAPPPSRRGAAAMRMAELSTRSGVPRETIHFYLREGLLPRPVKGGRTVAFYGPEHLERLRTIRRLREEKYLPLAVIRRLLDSPAAGAERDLDALADVLHLAAGSGADGGGAAPSEAGVGEALARGLLGPPRAGAGAAGGPPLEPEERRVLAIVDEVLGLGESARALTLDDLEACAAGLAGVVAREAEIFFDAALGSGDVAAAIAALRSGRGAVARFITAYRDLLLRRIVDELLLALERGPELVARSATLPLSAGAERRLGVPERRAALRGGGDAAALAWHLFACGAAAELAEIGADAAAAAGPVAALLVAWAAHERARSAATLRALEQAARAAPGVALGEILAGEAALARALGRRDPGPGPIEAAVPALGRVARADPETDEGATARAFGWFHRGRLEIALPPVLGRRRRGADALRRALVVADDAAIEPAGRARIRGNAALLLGRDAAARNDAAEARALFGQALEVDPEGAIGQAARAERRALGR